MSGQRAWTLGLLCFGMVLSMLLARRWLTPSVHDLAAAIEIYDVSAEELYATEGFRRHEGSPKTWSDISLAYQRDPAMGTYQKFLRCRIEAAEVRPSNRSFFAAGLPHRTGDHRPPAWWKQAGVRVGFNARGIAQWRMDRTERGWIGQYLSFEAATPPATTGWLHVWEWLDPQPPAAPLSEKPFGIDLPAQEVGQQLLSQQWPVRPDGWLEAPGKCHRRSGAPMLRMLIAGSCRSRAGLPCVCARFLRCSPRGCCLKACRLNTFRPLRLFCRCNGQRGCRLVMRTPMWSATQFLWRWCGLGSCSGRAQMW